MAKKQKEQQVATKIKAGTKINELSSELRSQIRKVEDESGQLGVTLLTPELRLKTSKVEEEFGQHGVAPIDRLAVIGDHTKKAGEEATSRGHLLNMELGKYSDDADSLVEAACAVDDYVHQQGKAAAKSSSASCFNLGFLAAGERHGNRDPLIADPKVECDLEPADVERVVNEYMYALQQLCDLGGDYLQVLENAVSVWDKRISDELHHLEMRDMPEEELIRSARVIALCRRKRRNIKNMLSALQALKNAGAFSLSHNVNAGAVAASVDKLDYREYKLRDPEHFYGVRGMNHSDYSVVIPYNMGEPDYDNLYPKWEGGALNG